MLNFADDLTSYSPLLFQHIVVSLWLAGCPTKSTLIGWRTCVHILWRRWVQAYTYVVSCLPFGTHMLSVSVWDYTQCSVHRFSRLAYVFVHILHILVVFTHLKVWVVVEKLNFNRVKNYILLCSPLTVNLIQSQYCLQWCFAYYINNDYYYC